MENSTDPHTMRTQGIRKNGERSFELHLRGREIYQLLHLLEELAVRDASYLEVRSAVYFAERLREQVKEQGF
jgi:hypothetical protein